MRWCENCQQQTRRIQSPFCQICGQSIPAGPLCKRCEQKRPQIEAIRSWAEFDGPIRNALHDLKYRKNIGLGVSLAHHLVAVLQVCTWDVDLVAPVPLGKDRERQRGYNQSDLLARPLAMAMQLPYNPHTLQRTRETQSQVELSLAERQKNLLDAFESQHDVRGKQILLIDDVATSGSTLEACAAALLKAGAKSVFGLTVARAVLTQ